MTKFISCLIASVFYLALADMKTVKENAAKKKLVEIASDSDSKQKRDASLMNGIYHVPSNQYLPSSSTHSYNSYFEDTGNSAILSGGYISGRGQSHHEISSYDHHNSNGVPLETLGETYNTIYHSQDSAVKEHGPVYAAYHKGLGHLSFSSNKPQVLHTSISDSSLKQLSNSKAPFKPSTILGDKFGGTSYHDAVSQHYLQYPEVGSGSPGYDYLIPSGSSISYQEPSYQQSVELQTTTVHK